MFKGTRSGDGAGDALTRQTDVACIPSDVEPGGIVTAYVIYQGEVLDPERYDQYRIKAAESILAAGGRYLVRGGDIDVLEGDPPASRTVVLEFRSREAALAWYRGSEYTEIRKIRDGAARARMYVVDGVD